MISSRGAVSLSPFCVGVVELYGTVGAMIDGWISGGEVGGKLRPASGRAGGRAPSLGM